MYNNIIAEVYAEQSESYEESLAEALSLELQRDSRRYSADFEN